MEQFEEPSFTLGVVNTNYLNMRTGPNITFKSIDILTKNEYIRIFAKIGDWYVIQTDSDFVGMVSKKYIKLIYQ